LRVLALDYGTARCGCAISDPTGTLVRPLEAIEPPDPEAVAELVAREEVERVVVGLPTTLTGKEGEQAKLSRAFADRLTELLDVPVETYDERLTTRMADQSARSGARADRDSLAAAHLLESYLMRGRSADARARDSATRDEREERPDSRRQRGEEG
jgi:putative Holliday junction resolvase